MSALSQDFGAPSGASTAGAILAAARREQRFDVADVSARLRVSVAQVEALESDQYDRLPGTTFIRGIIRNYARMLQIDAQPALDAFARVAAATERTSINVPTYNIRFQPGVGTDRGRAVKLGLLLLALLVAAGAAWLWYTAPAIKATQAESRLTAKPQAKVVQAIAPLEPAAPPSLQSLGDAPAAVTGNAAPVGSVATSAVQAPAPVLAAPAPAATGAAVLRFTFKKPSWVQVKDSTGQILLLQDNPAGSEQVVTGKPPFKLVVGNAAFVQLTYNDKPVSLTPHIKITVARFTLP